MRKPVPDLAKKGVTSVSVEVAAMPIKKIFFPPNLVAKNPPETTFNSV